MPYDRQPDSLEDQLREEKRLAAARRRRRRKRWLLPTLAVLILLGILIAVLLLFSPKQEPQTPPETTAPPADVRATLLAAGDVTLDQQILRAAFTGDGFDFQACFSPLQHSVSTADLAIVNVEGNFCGAPYDADGATYPESLLTALHDCGFDVVQTANSYSIENGLSGLCSTKDAIELAGMLPLGTFRSEQERAETGGVSIVDCNGLRIALIGMTKGTNGLHLPEGAEYSVNLLFEDYDTNYNEIDRSAISALLQNAQALEPDVIVCMVHWGSEYTSEVSPSQEALAELLFSEGANLIIGTHSHVVGPIEGPSTVSVVGTRATGLVAYGLGDLLSASDRESAHAGCMLQVSFAKKDGRTTIEEIRCIPTYSAYPSEEYETTTYQVFDTLDAIHLYESSYIYRVSTPLYEHLQETVETVRERIGSGYLTEKDYRD